MSRWSVGSKLRLVGLDRFSAIYLWAAFMVIFGIMRPGTFLTTGTFRSVFASGVITAIVAFAFLIPLVAGAFDLSVGAQMGMSLAIATWLGLHHMNPVWGSVIAVACTSFGGFVIGFVVVRLRVPSFIATLGAAQIITALTLLISQNQQMVGAFSNEYQKWGNRNVFGIPVVILYLLVIGLALWYVLEHTALGRHLAAVGGNAEASRLAGVRTDRMIWGSFVASGAMAGLAGILYSLEVAVYTPGVGPNLLFPAVTAVFLGSSQLSKRPNVWGTVIAWYCLAFGEQGLQLRFPVSTYWVTPMFDGIALVIAVALANRTDSAALHSVRRFIFRKRKDQPEDDGANDGLNREPMDGQIEPSGPSDLRLPAG